MVWFSNNFGHYFYFALVITGCTDGIGKAYTQEVILELNNIVNNKDGYLW